MTKNEIDPHAIAEDNWEHRSAYMHCASCMWYVPKKTLDNKDTHLGRCRRRAPTISGFPAVFNTDWCGDHKLNEEKL